MNQKLQPRGSTLVHLCGLCLCIAMGLLLHERLRQQDEAGIAILQCFRVYEMTNTPENYRFCIQKIKKTFNKDNQNGELR